MLGMKVVLMMGEPNVRLLMLADCVPSVYVKFAT